MRTFIILIKKKQLLWLMIPVAFLLILLLVRNDYFTRQSLAEENSSIDNEEVKPINKYNEFNIDVSMIKDNLSPDGFVKLTNGDILNQSLTSFPDYQELDGRTHDGVNNNSSSPSRYELLYLSEDETILVRLNLIYAPEFTTTKILSLQSFSPGRIEFVDKEYQGLISPSITSYLISYKNGLAQVDFFSTNKFPSNEDSYFHLLNEGEEKFLPTLQDFLLEITNKEK